MKKRVGRKIGASMSLQTYFLCFLELFTVEQGQYYKTTDKGIALDFTIVYYISTSNISIGEKSR